MRQQFNPLQTVMMDPNASMTQFQEALNDFLEEGVAGEKFHAVHPLTACLDVFLQNQAPSPEETEEIFRKKEALTAAIKSLLGGRGQGYIAMAQINPVPGDLAGNAAKIMAYLQVAEQTGVDMVVFPELSLMGYPIADVIQRYPFLVAENLKWLRAIADRTGQTRAVVGFVEPRRDPAHTAQKVTGKPFFNALAILGEGRIEGIVRKNLLPTYNEFYDNRTFEACPAAGVHPAETLGRTDMDLDLMLSTGGLSMLHGRAVGLSICEDIWNDADFFEQPLYRRDPIAELAGLKPELLVNISASPSRSRKEQMKHNMLAHVARKYRLPLVYVNQVGAVDEISFDGASRVYDAEGRLIARAKAFAEQLMIVNPLTGEGVIEPLSPGLEKTLQAQKVFDPADDSDLGRTVDTVLQGIRDYFAKTGFQRAVLGLSGGLDSSVVAVLLVAALGKENVLGVSMPSALTSPESREDARHLAKNLGMPLVELPITAMVTAFETGLSGENNALEAHWGKVDPASFARDNVQAISRSTMLRMIGNDYRALPIATSDKSELYLGYATVNGDMSGALMPLGDVPKTKVRQLARWLNAHWEPQGMIPERVITKPSGAELALDPETGKPLTAEEALMPYEFADEIIWRIEALQQSKAEMMAETFYWEQQNGLSSEEKQRWLDRFFRRMAAAVFKWWVAPPSIIVEGNGSITKTDYRHPMTACRIRWEGTSEAEIARVLDRIVQTGGKHPLSCAPPG